MLSYCFFLYVISGCVSVESLGDKTLPDSRYIINPKIRILNSDIWVTHDSNTVTIEHRLIYKLVSPEKFTEVLLSHRLKDKTQRTLSKRSSKETQRPGIYPITLSFKLSKKDISYDLFFIETTLSTSFGEAIDNKPFTLATNVVNKPTEGEKRFDIYKYIQSTESCPHGYRLVVHEITGALKENTEKIWLECVPKEEKSTDTVDEMNIYYPVSGRHYPIKKEQYPEFYKKSDLNGDGLVTLDEIGDTRDILNAITTKYPEGDIDSIVKEFIRTKFK